MNFVKSFFYVSLLFLCCCKDISEVKPPGEKMDSEDPDGINAASGAPANTTGDLSDNQGFALSSNSPKDHQTVQPVAGNSESQSYKKYFFPFDREITDTKNRSIDAHIIAKRAGNLILYRKSDRREFVIPISSLSEGDRNFFRKVDDGGDYDKAFEKMQKRTRLKGRTATWYTNLESATKEARSLEIPILVVVLIYGHEKSRPLSDIFYSSEFRQWANENVSLCMLQVDDPRSNRTSSSNSAPNRRDAGKLGMSVFNSPAVMLVKGTKKRVLSIDSFKDHLSATKFIEKSLDTETNWQTFQPIPIR